MGSFEVMQLCFLLFHSVMSFGEILTEVVILRAFLLHALKSSLLTGAEARAAEPWTAPLLRGCWLPEGEGGSWGNFPRKAALV